VPSLVTRGNDSKLGK